MYFDFFSFFILYFVEGGGGGRSRLLVDFELIFCILHFVFCILVIEEVEVVVGCCWTLSLYFEVEVGAGCCWRWSSGKPENH